MTDPKPIMTEGDNGQAIEHSGRVPDLVAEQQQKLLDSMSPEDRKKYEFVVGRARREAWLFSQSLSAAIEVMPPPARHSPGQLEEGPRFDQGTIFVALKIYEQIRPEYMNTFAKKGLLSWLRPRKS